MSKFTTWMKNSTSAEKKLLAQFSKVNFFSLYSIKLGRHSASAETAAKLEKAAARVWRVGLPILKRQDIATVCRKCPYAIKCGKGS